MKRSGPMIGRRVALAIALATGMPAIANEKAPKVIYDPYQRATAVTGSNHSHNALLDLNKWDWWLSDVILNGVPMNPSIMVSTYTPEWYFFDSASDIDGQQLPVSQVQRDVVYGGVREVFGIELTPKYLHDHRTAGMNIKIMGSRGSQVIVVPAEAVAAFEPTFLAEVQKVGGFHEGATVAKTASASEQVAAHAAAQGGLGISFFPLPDGIYLIAIAPGSRADRAHLSVGQTITAVDGKSVAGLTSAEDAALVKSATGQIVLSVEDLGEVRVDP